MTKYQKEDYIKYRLKGGYNDIFDFDEETILRLFPVSIEFIGTIEKLLEMTD